jgi:CHASE3 domain sensor protein
MQTGQFSTEAISTVIKVEVYQNYLLHGTLMYFYETFERVTRDLCKAVSGTETLLKDNPNLLEHVSLSR